jgi:hypothetical protein
MRIVRGKAKFRSGGYRRSSGAGGVRGIGHVSTMAQLQAKPALKPSYTPVRNSLLQRKCACGGTPGPSGKCAECREKGPALRFVTDQAVLSTLLVVVHGAPRSLRRPCNPAAYALLDSGSIATLEGWDYA